MFIKIKVLLSCFFLFLVVGALAGNEIQQIRSNSLSDKLQIVIDINNKPEFNVFALSNPLRLVLDVKAKASANYKNKLSFKNRGVTKVRTGNRSAEEIRFVLDLNYDYNWEVYDLAPSGRHGYRVVVDVFDFSVGDKKKRKNNALAVKSPNSKVTKKASTITLESVGTSGKPKDKNIVVSKVKLKKDDSQVNSTKKIPKKPAIVIKVKPPVKPLKKPKSSNKVITKRIVASTIKKSKSRKIVVIIDPGHGGKDSGAKGASGTKEKVVVLQIAKKLKRKIDKMSGMRAVLTRKNDRYISLRGRLRLARKYKGDLFVSIHADAFTRRSARGASVYILSNRGASSEAARWLAKRENAVDLKYGVDIGNYERDVSDILMKMQQDAAIEASNILANKTLSRLKGIGKVHKRRVERAGFAVLKSPDIPSMLVETAFISNPEEERRLRSSSYQNKLASAISKGIKQYFDVHLPHHLLQIDAPKR